MPGVPTLMEHPGPCCCCTGDWTHLLLARRKDGCAMQASKAASGPQPQHDAPEEEAQPAASEPPVKQEPKLSKADKRRLAREQQQARSERAHRSEQRATLFRYGPRLAFGQPLSCYFHCISCIHSAA